MRRPKAELVLSEAERKSLESMARRTRSVPQLARRARIILKCAERVDNNTVAHQLRVTPQMVGKWRVRFVSERLEGLNDEPRPGAPRQVADAQVEEVIVPPDLDIHVIMDNYGTHKTALIRNWFAQRPRFHPHFTPTSGSWLNLVERWFAELTNKQIRRGSHRSVRELHRAIAKFLDAHNQKPRPFVWTKTADGILASIARFAHRTLETHGPSLIKRTIGTGH